MVDVETLRFRPADGSRLQMARRGKPFQPGNLCGRGGARGMCRDGKRYEGAVQDQSYVDVDESKEDVIGDDDILTNESTS